MSSKDCIVTGHPIVVDPSGKKLLTVVQAGETVGRGGGIEAFVSPLNGRKPTKILDLDDWSFRKLDASEAVTAPMWSPSGNTIVFLGEHDLYMVRL